MSYSHKKPTDKFTDLSARGSVLRNEPREWASAEEFTRSSFGKFFRVLVNCRTNEHMISLWRASITTRESCEFCLARKIPCVDPPPTKPNSVRCAACLARCRVCCMTNRFYAWLSNQCLGISAEEFKKFSDWIREAAPVVPKLTREQKALRMSDSESSESSAESESDYSDENTDRYRRGKRTPKRSSVDKTISTPGARASYPEPPSNGKFSPSTLKRAALGRDSRTSSAADPLKNGNGIHDSDSPRFSKRKRTETPDETYHSQYIKGHVPDPSLLVGKLYVESGPNDEKIVVDRKAFPDLTFQPPYFHNSEKIETFSDIFTHLYQMEYRSSRANLEKQMKGLFEEQEKTIREEYESQSKQKEERRKDKVEKMKQEYESQLSAQKTRASVMTEEMKLLEKERNETGALLKSAHGIIEGVKAKEETWEEEKRRLSKEILELKGRLAASSFSTSMPPPPSSSVSLPPSTSDERRVRWEAERADTAEARLVMQRELAAAIVQDLGSVATWLDGFARHSDQPGLADVSKELFSLTGRLSVMAMQVSTYHGRERAQGESSSARR